MSELPEDRTWMRQYLEDWAAIMERHIRQNQDMISLQERTLEQVNVLLKMLESGEDLSRDQANSTREHLQAFQVHYDNQMISFSRDTNQSNKDLIDRLSNMDSGSKLRDMDLKAVIYKTNTTYSGVITTLIISAIGAIAAISRVLVAIISHH